MEKPHCLYVELPLTEYRKAWDLQQTIVTAKTRGALENDVVLVLEHPPVYTLGRRGGIENLCVPKERLAREGIEVVPVERGGDITYHGPGQLVAYPLLDIRRARMGITDLVTCLEEIMIETAGDFDVQAQRNPLNRAQSTSCAVSPITVTSAGSKAMPDPSHSLCQAMRAMARRSASSEANPPRGK